MSNVYDVGDRVRISASFADEGASPSDPSPVRLRYRDPAGTVTTLVYGTDPELVRDGVGAYHADLDAAAAGTWHYRAEGEASPQAAGEARFRVRGSVFS